MSTHRSLGDLTIWSSGGTPSKQESAYWEGDIPWISASSMKTSRLYDSASKITKLGLQEGSRLAEKGAILLLVRGSELHKRVPVGIAMRSLAFNQDVKAIKTFPEIVPEYLLYWFLANNDFLLTNVEYTGIGAGKLDTQFLKSIKIQLPSISEQKAITSILSTLDDKIELNHQMNQTLEQMAQAIFKSWFIDFDPVKAKAEGKKPFGMTDEVAAILPSEFEESELGMIPKGWRVGIVDDFYYVNPRRQLVKDSGAPYLDMSNVSTTGCMPISEILPRKFRGGSRFMNGDTLLARITPCLENGKTSYVAFLNDQEIGWGSTEFIVLQPKEPLPSIFGYLLARNENFRTYAIKSMTGSSGRQRVDLTAVRKYPFIAPSISICNEFSNLVNPFFEKIHFNWKESQKLSSLRDTLLPKLISGEIRVKQAEKLVSEVV